MPRRPPLPKSELEVARVLWDLGEATPREVYQSYCKKRKVAFETVQCFLRRLEAKGYIRARREGKKKFYRARVRPSTVIRETVNDLMDRLFDGEALPLVRHVIEDGGISNEEIQHFREMLSRLEAQRDESSGK